jgi:hypothetical protein
VTRSIAAAAIFGGAVITGTLLDPAAAPAQLSASVLAADLHVHPYPGDGSLPVWELQREAARRGLDVIAVTGHNNRLGIEIGRLVPLEPDGPIVRPGQEITAPGFHMIAVGIERLIDWRLSAHDAIEAIHGQGGVAIAAHPLPISWRENDAEALKALDGAEVAHPSTLAYSQGQVGFETFFVRVQSINPRVAPIGSTDFHMVAPLGLCRTYLLTDNRSAAGALDAIRRGRTVARNPNGRLFGAAEHVAVVERHLSSTAPVPAVPLLDRLIALAALCSLGALSAFRKPY